MKSTLFSFVSRESVAVINRLKSSYPSHFRSFATFSTRFISLSATAWISKRPVACAASIYFSHSGRESRFSACFHSFLLFTMALLVLKLETTLLEALFYLHFPKNKPWKTNIYYAKKDSTWNKLFWERILGVIIFFLFLLYYIIMFRYNICLLKVY